MCSQVASCAVVTDIHELVPCWERRRAEGAGISGGRSTEGEKKKGIGEEHSSRKKTNGMKIANGNSEHTSVIYWSRVTMHACMHEVWIFVGKRGKTGASTQERSETNLHELVMALFWFATGLADPEEGLQGIPQLALAQAAGGPALGFV